MITLTYFQFAIFLAIVLIIGIGITWRIERNRYERLTDMFTASSEKLMDALRDEMLENERLKQENHNEKLKNELLKKRFDSLQETCKVIRKQ